MSTKSSKLFLILGNQLFNPKLIPADLKSSYFMMVEDLGLCTHFKYHKHKLIHFLASMRHYFDELNNENIQGVYYKLDTNKKTYAIGNNEFGQLGLGKNDISSVDISMIAFENDISTITVSYSNPTGQLTNQLLTCGDNSYGQLGLDITDTKIGYFSPVLPTDFSIINVRDIQ